MRSITEIINAFEIVDQFFKDVSLYKAQSEISEEKFQILVHSLQNKGLPKQSRKFVEELRKIRHERWINRQLCLASQNKQTIELTLGTLKMIEHPVVRNPKLGLEKYLEFVETL